MNFTNGNNPSFSVILENPPLAEKRRPLAYDWIWVLS
jgi:hypothetical protein